MSEPLFVSDGALSAHFPNAITGWNATLSPPFAATGLTRRSARQFVMAVAWLEKHLVRVLWEDGLAEEVDLLPILLGERRYIPLRNDSRLFSTLSVSSDGKQLLWADGTAVAVDRLAELAEGTLSNEEFRQAMRYLSTSIEGLARELGVSRAQITAFRSRKPIPRHIALAVRFLVALRGRRRG